MKRCRFRIYRQCNQLDTRFYTILSLFPKRRILKIDGHNETSEISLDDVHLLQVNDNAIVTYNNQIFLYLTNIITGHHKISDVTDFKLNLDQQPEYFRKFANITLR